MFKFARKHALFFIERIVTRERLKRIRIRFTCQIYSSEFNMNKSITEIEWKLKSFIDWFRWTKSSKSFFSMIFHTQHEHLRKHESICIAKLRLNVSFKFESWLNEQDVEWWWVDRKCCRKISRFIKRSCRVSNSNFRENRRTANFVFQKLDEFVEQRFESSKKMLNIESDSSKKLPNSEFRHRKTRQNLSSNDSNHQTKCRIINSIHRKICRKANFIIRKNVEKRIQFIKTFVEQQIESSKNSVEYQIRIIENELQKTKYNRKSFECVYKKHHQKNQSLLFVFDWMWTSLIFSLIARQIFQDFENKNENWQNRHILFAWMIFKKSK